MSRGPARIQFSGSRIRPYGGDGDLDMSDQSSRPGVFRAQVPSFQEKKDFFTLRGAIDEHERAERPEPSQTALTAAEKVRLSTSLGTVMRNGRCLVDGLYDPPSQQGMVMVTCDLPFGAEYQFRTGVAQQDRIGRLGSSAAMAIWPYTIAFTHAKTSRTAPSGMPDTNVFSHLGGLDKRSKLQVVGIFTADNPHIKDGNSNIAVAVSGTPAVANTGNCKIPAFCRLAVDPNPVVSHTEDGVVPFFQVKGHQADTLYPAFRPFDDADASQMASLVFTQLEETLDSLGGKDWFDAADEKIKELFNDDGYDMQHKKPIQFYADWAAIHIALTERDHTAIAGRIKRLMHEEQASPDFAKFCEDFGEDLDITKDDEIRALLDGATGREFPEAGSLSNAQKRKLRFYVQRKMNACIGEQHSWEGRMLIGKPLNTVPPGGWIRPLI